MSSKKLNPFKDFQSDQIQRSSRKIFTAHYACRNAALNLTPVKGTTKGFIFQIINSLIESCGVRLTWFDCNYTETVIFWNDFVRKNITKKVVKFVLLIHLALVNIRVRSALLSTPQGTPLQSKMVYKRVVWTLRTESLQVHA